MRQGLLTLLLILVSIASAQAYDFVDGDFSFNILSEDDATVELAKSTAPSQSNEIYVPSTILHNGKSYTVTRIGEKAFYQINTQNLMMYIPETITSIGDSGIAACWHLYWIEIYGTEGTVQVGENFLKWCDELEVVNFCREIEYPDGTLYPALRGKKHMYTCHLGGSIIHDYEFQGCTGLQTVDITGPVTSIGDYAFSQTPNLTWINHIDYNTDIDYFDTVTSMGEYAFSECGYKYAILPKNLKAIPRYAFAHSDVTSAYFDPDSKTESIGQYAFYGCSNLQRLMTYGSLEQIDSHAFDGCTSLTRVDLYSMTDFDNLLFDSGDLLFNASSYDDTFFKDAPIEQIDLDRNLKLDNGDYSALPFDGLSSLVRIRLLEHCTAIPDNLFKGCASLGSINFETSQLKEIGIGAFSQCMAIPATIRFPATLKYVKTSAFKGCSNIANVVFNKGLQYIGSYSFSGTALSTVNIPGSVTEVHNNAFKDCESLKTVCFDNGDEPIGCSGNPFADSPVTSLTLGRTFIPEGTTFGEDNFYATSPFRENTTLCDLTVTSGVTEIQYNAFGGCTSLSHITLGENLETISGYAFAQCPLTTIYSAAQKAPDVDIEHPVFDESIFADAMLKIPDGSAITSYNTADIWRDFYKVSTLHSDNLYCHDITLSESEIFSDSVDTFGITAYLTPEDAANKNLDWSSSDEDVALVDDNGNVTVLRSGTTVITAATTDGTELTASCNVSVKLVVTDIVLNQTDIYLREQQSVRLIATVSPESADNKTLQWSSSDESVATVGQDGWVYAIAQGSAVITVKSTDGSGIKAECKVNVSKVVGTEDVASDDIVVSVCNSVIRIDNLTPGSRVSVIQANGTEIFRTVSVGERILFRPSAKGVYFIVTGNRNYKAAVL